MGTVTAGLLDTSLLIDLGRADRKALPDEAAISVMTLAELHIGVLLARDPSARATRLRSLAEAERQFDPLPVDRAVAQQFAGIVATERAAGRRPPIVDALIAATALAHSLILYTRDRGFERLLAATSLQIV